MPKRRANGEMTALAIRHAAVKLIAEHGFQGMNLRELADRIGIKAGSLYNHIDSKQRLLFDLLRGVMEDVLATMEAALDGHVAPEDRLRVFVRQHIEFHVDRRQEVFIGNMELRSLTNAQYAKIVALRSQYEKCLQAILEAGVAAGRFSVPNVKMATFGVISMLTGVCQWYRPNGPLSRDQLVDIHTILVFQMAGANDVRELSAPLRASA
jgi:AcrR family transcriptional regulator